MHSELRKHYFLDQYVLIAPRRGQRPHRVGAAYPNQPSPKDCAFCPKNVNKNETIIDRVGTGGRWEIAAITNLYPAVSEKNPAAYGHQEIIIETPHPTRQLENFTTNQIAELLKFYGKRTANIKKDKKTAYINIFKNFGERAGATLPHAHSQVMALGFVPPQVAQEQNCALSYKLQNGLCPYCDIIKKEARGPRFIGRRNGVVALAPQASRFPYETWILPERHVDNVTELTAKERTGIAALLRAILGKLARLDHAYNLFFHEIVADRDQHFMITIAPRGNIWAGVEIGSGIMINSVAPEEAAKFYRS